MTRKDYVETAKILNQYVGKIDEVIFDNLVADFAIMFEDDNPKFLGNKFVDACWEEN
jgi:hypothetical protein